MKTLIIILLLSIASLVKSQSLDKANIYQIIDTTYTYISETNNHKLAISLVSNYEENEFWHNSYLVSVFGKRNVIQTFSKFNDQAESEEDFLLEDVNFDDFDDLMVLSTIDNTGNYGYEYWIFDPEKKQYFLDEQLSELIAGNPSFNKTEKTYTTGGRLGIDSYSFSTYKYVNGELILIKEEYQEPIIGQDDDGNVIITLHYCC
ncbi:XAC2610-related protein [Bacteroidota bacterium]